MNNARISRYQGVIVPMVTPFTPEGKIDRSASAGMIQYLLDNGTIPFILGTSGEVYSIASNDRDVLVKILLEHRKADIPLIVGMGGLTFEDTVHQANRYFEWGIDAVVLTLPGYFPLTDHQIYHYFYEVAQRIRGDIILYNIPVTIHNSIPIQVADALSKMDNIIGIKDSESDEKRMVESLKLWAHRNNFFYLVGVHEYMIQGLILGADGLVPSTANLVPDLYTRMFSLHLEGKSDEVEKIYRRTNEILHLYRNGHSLSDSLAILKYLVSLKGLVAPYMLPPLTELSDKKKQEVACKWDNILST